MSQLDQGMPALRVTPRTSEAAVASLVCGLLGCIPAVTSMAAIVLGIVGLRAARRPNVRGRGLAIAGLVLGVFGLVSWAGIGTAMYGVYTASKAPAQEADAFLRDLAGGNVQAATARCALPMTAESVEALAKQLQQWGQFKDLSLMHRSAEVSGGLTTWELSGKARFDKASTKITFTVVRRPDGTCRITSIKLPE